MNPEHVVLIYRPDRGVWEPYGPFRPGMSELDIEEWYQRAVRYWGSENVRVVRCEVIK